MKADAGPAESRAACLLIILYMTIMIFCYFIKAYRRPELYPLHCGLCSVFFCLGLPVSHHPYASALCPTDRIGGSRELLEASDAVEAGKGLAWMPALEVPHLHRLSSPQPLELVYSCRTYCIANALCIWGCTSFSSLIDDDSIGYAAGILK
jgi:hypothetical protein